MFYSGCRKQKLPTRLVNLSSHTLVLLMLKFVTFSLFMSALFHGVYVPHRFQLETLGHYI